ncbi:VRR-NUC domain-containing protein [Hymenobacter algoricola]|uniref:VRR-NUC domain-containing protein n=1 Tax=Hymenobacter algoricola TaxID=486267 RepID=A0ABP7NCN0_9BACT
MGRFTEDLLKGRIVATTQRRAPPASKDPPAADAPLKARKKPDTSGAASLTKAALALLALHGFTMWRQNNGGVWDPTRQLFRAGSSTPGISDTLGYHRVTGRFCAVEIKYGKDTLSKPQTAFLAEVRRAGGFACCCRSIDQLERELKLYLTSLSQTL